MELVEQLNSFTEPGGRAQLKARLKAWWDGKEYDHEAFKTELEQQQAEDSEVSARLKPLEDAKKVSKASPRIAALETIWGRGRYVPGSGELDSELISAIGRVRGRIGRVGLLGADALTADVIAEACGENVELVDWREPCSKRSSELTENAKVSFCDLDRMNAFEDGSLKTLLSVDAMSYVDHKAGLSARAYRALRDGGRWVLLDYSALNTYTPKTSFASAWAEPQLMNCESLQDVVLTTGFKYVRRIDASLIVKQAAKAAFTRMGAALEDVVASGIGGRDGALMLQEVAWEAAAWRSRLKALEAGVLRADIWIFEKPGALIDDEITDQSAPPAKLEEELFSPGEAAPVVEAVKDEEELEDGFVNAASEDTKEEAWEVNAAEPEEEADEEIELDQNAVDSLFD